MRSTPRRPCVGGVGRGLCSLVPGACQSRGPPPPGFCRAMDPGTARYTRADLPSPVDCRAAVVKKYLLTSKPGRKERTVGATNEPSVCAFVVGAGAGEGRVEGELWARGGKGVP